MPAFDAPIRGTTDNHIDALDGWRAISILFVLAAHLLPLGPKSWQLNVTAGYAGMALFFTLSGFLITTFLLSPKTVLEFLIRRAARILPLAWLGMLVALLMSGARGDFYAPNLLFYANLPPIRLTDVGSHMWSLCVEIQFYVGVALLISVAGRRALWLLPVLCFGVTAHRIIYGAYGDIVTWRRIDEILAGAILALAYGKLLPNIKFNESISSKWISYIFLTLLLLISSHPSGGALNYARPYISAGLVGLSIFYPIIPISNFLSCQAFRYIARISFSIYVIHHLLMYSWLGDGERLVKYLKRPILLAITGALAHFSTFYFEAWFIAAGRKMSLNKPFKYQSTRPPP